MEDKNQLLAKYGITNSKYRLIKEIVLTELEINILEKNKIKISNRYRNKNIKSTSSLGDRLEKTLTTIEKSLNKKRNRLARLNREFVSSYSEEIDLKINLNITPQEKICKN